MGQILIPTALAEQIEAEARELHAEDYIGQLINIRQGQTYKPWGRRGFTCVEQLTFLKGRKWDDVALGFVHSLRPSHIRVTESGTQMDSQTWRVTVYVTKTGFIKEISQEVEVGLPKDVKNGHEMNEKLKD